MVARLAWCVVLAGGACGRLDFGVRGDGGGGDETGAPADAATAPNVAFVTSAAFDGNLGGLAGADATCQSIARGAGLAGTYVAMLSSSNIALATRVGGARGWVRTDGAPLFDQITDLFTSKVFNPFDHDEHGTAVAESGPWTGTRDDGTVADACQDWTSNGADLGAIGDTSFATPFMLSSGEIACSLQRPIYCLEIDRDAVVAPTPGAGRIAFQSTPIASGGGVVAFDGQCQNDATAAGLPGTYLAAIATSTASIDSRFVGDARTVRRVDGQVVAASVATLFASPTSFVDQRADGTYNALGADQVWDGIMDATTVSTASCSDWTDGSNAESAFCADAKSTTMFWNGGAATCDAALGVICLEQ